MPKTLIGGVYETEEKALRAIESLKEMGFDTKQLSVFAKDKDTVEDIEDRTDVNAEADKDDRGSHAGKGFGIGAGTGGVLGGIAGLIAEIGLLTIPGIGVLAAAGPLATTLSGAAIGATGGGIVGALTGAGIPDENAKEYEEYLKNGHILLIAEVDEEQREKLHGAFRDAEPVTTDVFVVK
ncbi:general stress protein [Indiicoccus explosivorum]|uniref:general stress protein n=1 Tax=Indiicoccus explosivorum TaxID=1917864 RepID=UPI000B42EE04|nr:general stress protein [Indiicoccus explosivorum]